MVCRSSAFTVGGEAVEKSPRHWCGCDGAARNSNCGTYLYGRSSGCSLRRRSWFWSVGSLLRSDWPSDALREWQRGTEEGEEEAPGTGTSTSWDRVCKNIKGPWWKKSSNSHFQEHLVAKNCITLHVNPKPWELSYTYTYNKKKTIVVALWICSILTLTTDHFLTPENFMWFGGLATCKSHT